MPLSTQTKNQIIDLLTKYQTAYNHHDPAALAETLAPDILMYGCRTDEILQGRDAFTTMMTNTKPAASDLKIPTSKAKASSPGSPQTASF